MAQRPSAPRISVINDNAEFLELMAAILADDSGYEVTLHRGDDTSIAEIRDAGPELIVVDLLLGGASGWEIVTLARSDDALRAVPIVIVSADVPQLRERAGELEGIGNVHLLEKPFAIEELMGLVERLVGRAGATAGESG